ncbi:MAG: hypothetical protein U1E20_14875 [Methylocystis sp.]|uniref:hypothetical protein n=1 Tax=Methylocystis sp. TaxID=1911079 RepID=UPI003927BFE7
MTAMMTCDADASAMMRVMGTRMIVMGVTAVAAPAEAESSEYRADEPQLRRRRLGIQNDKWQRQGAEQQGSARKPTFNAGIIVNHGIRPRRRQVLIIVLAAASCQFGAANCIDAPIDFVLSAAEALGALVASAAI